MSFFSRLFRRRGVKKQRPSDQPKPAGRAAPPAGVRDTLSALRHQARTGDPTIIRHRRGNIK